MTQAKTLILLLVISLLGAPIVRGGDGTLTALEKEITSLVETVKPSLVTVEAVRGDGLGRKWVGSGVVWTQDGKVVTTASLISEDDNVTVSLADGRKQPAKILGIEDERNLALLKVEAQGLTPIKRGNSEAIKPGSWVTVIGNSYGLASAVSFGLVNGVRGEDSLLQISASVAPGNTGGPVLNTQGEMVGLIAGKMSEPMNFGPIQISEDKGIRMYSLARSQVEMPASGTALAISSNRVQSVCEKLEKYGTTKKGYLGVRIKELTPDLKENYKNKEGLLVSDVVPDSPAKKAGIQDGDILTEFDGKKIKDAEEFRNEVALAQPGKKVKVKVLREGKEKTLTAELGASPTRSSSLRAEVFKGLTIPEINIPGLEVEIPKPEIPGFDRQDLDRQMKELRKELKKAQKDLDEIRKELKGRKPGQERM
jgi:serine protease Do